MSSSNQQPRTALLLIDIQDGFTHLTHWGPSRSNPSFEANIKSLLPIYRELISSTTSRTQTSPHKIIHVAHASKSAQSTLHPSKPGFAFQSFATPSTDELVIEKNVNSAFIGTDLEKLLRQHFDGAPGTLWVVGLTTDHCVSTSVRMAGNLGVCDGLDGEKGEVVLVENATACWKKSEDTPFDAEMIHAVHVDSLKEFASIAKTGQVEKLWKEWISDAN
ncbi:isochorismatase family hydrolase [Hyaloscypha finlandica]|nr:isochorismatase family hydrolase [Hyaloscypha finlandica]